MSKHILNENLKCPVCRNANTKSIYHLPNYPLTELFCKIDEKNKYSLNSLDQTFCFCEFCNHGFLKTIINPSFLYQSDNYNTISSNSKGAMISLDNFAKFINKSNLYSNKYVIDIGGNDSNLLDSINAQQGSVIDPNCKINNPAYKTINLFFEEVDPKDLNYSEISIVSSHTLEHIEDPHKFFKFLLGIKNASIFFLQFPSLELMVESQRFDLINHQHIHYYSLESIKRLAEIYRFKIIRYEYDHDHYGVLRIEIIKENDQNYLLPSGKKYSSDFLINLIKTFDAFTKKQNLFLQNFDNIYCYGASLMLPITFYYYPNLKNSHGIFDANISKSKIRYSNIDIPIIHDNDIDISSTTIFVTANGTRYANRVILKNLLDRNPQYLINPFPTF